MSGSVIYRFDNWLLLPTERSLRRDGVAVKIGSRALDLLMALIEQRHCVVPKHELMDLVWPGLMVEEGNLHVQMVALRKLLGPTAVATIPGRGYRFALPVEVQGGPPAAVVEAAPATPPAAAPAPSGPGPLPVPLSSLIGRRAELLTLHQLLHEHDLVTVTGPGGIGKTCLAGHAAADYTRAHGMAAWSIELAAITDPALVAATVAQALGARIGIGHDAAEAIATRLSETLDEAPALLLLDNVEQVLGAVAELVQALRKRRPGLRWLVTSQEPLRLPGECVMRLAPLEVPPDSDAPKARHAGAVALFLMRVALADPRRADRDPPLEAVVDICRRLDGMPLAIELAAARVPLLGIDGVRARLDDRFRLLVGGARTAPSRQQTLRAALEWSHALLSPEEQRVFRRLGVFVGGFVPEAAQQVAGDDEIDAWGVIDHVSSLVDKSLVITRDDGTDAPRCLLLESARLFALEQLEQAGEAEATRRRHAEAMATLFGPASPRSRAWFKTGQSSGLAEDLPNVRAAFDWALRSGDTAAGVALISAVHTVHSAAGQARECSRRLQALALRAGPELAPTVAASLWRSAARSSTGVASAFAVRAATEAVERYRALDEREPLCESLMLLVAFRARRGELNGLDELMAQMLQHEDAVRTLSIRANVQWALHRWRLARDEPGLALAHTLRMAETVSGRPDAFDQVILGGNAAWCELAMGQPEAAERRARHAVDTLRRLGATSGYLGYPLQVLAEALLALGRDAEGIDVARQAQPPLAADSDDLCLLEPLAFAMVRQGRAEQAARMAGHVDAAMRAIGEQRWPYQARRRRELDALLADALAPEVLAGCMDAGAALDRGRMFELTFAAPGSNMDP